MREPRSRRAARTSDALPSPIIFGSPFMAALMGVKNPRAAGEMIDAWRSCPTKVCNDLMGTVFRRRTRLISRTYLVAFSEGKRTVRLIPSNKKPIISFVLMKSPSPFSIFLSEIGSLPSLCPVIAGSGKTEWIAWMAARRTLGMCVPSVDSVVAWQKSST